jgi:hypothetical protein
MAAMAEADRGQLEADFLAIAQLATAAKVQPLFHIMQ